jgi:hypothetical protein
MTQILLWLVISAFGIAWLVHQFWPEKGVTIWVRLASISALGVFAVGTWGVLNWIWHLIRK